MPVETDGSDTCTRPAAAVVDAAAPESPDVPVDYVPLRRRQRIVAASEVPRSPFITLALCWMLGILLGAMMPWVSLWLPMALVGVAMIGRALLRRDGQRVRILGIGTLITAGAAWFVVHDRYVAADHLSHYITAEPQLAEVTGFIEGPIIVASPQRGAFAKFSYEPPSTTFIIDVRSIVVSGQAQTTAGKLTAKLRQAETRLREGDCVAVTGWMQAIDGPSNPGDFDYRAMYRERSIDGRIVLNVRANCRVLDAAPSIGGLNALRTRVADRCAESLRLGLQSDPQRIAFLDTILLGRWSRDLEELTESFRKTGLIHILSISGAHLTILMLLVWMVVHSFARHPAWAASLVLVVLLLYMLAVPWRVPIVRAGIMAALVCAGAASGRRVRAIDMIALSAFVVFVWRPADLFNAGAQLSFGVVAGLLVFTAPVSRWLWPDSPVDAPADEMRARLARRCFDYLAANIVAFVIAFPLVAFHFQFVSPLSILLSLLSLPVVTAVLGLGYLKILAGAIMPSAGVVLAGPLEWVSDSMTGLVEHASHWPASTVMLGSPPSVAWLIGTLVLGCAIMAGLFAQRRGVMWLAISVCMAWLLIPHHPRVAAWFDSLRAQPALRMHMFAVGDGSCFLIQIAGSDQRRGHIILFDCGSQGFLNVGSRSIVPSLRALNVNRIDTLIVSHADLDHFCGVLDVAKEVPIGRALVPPQMLREAEQDASSAAAYLIDGLRGRRLEVDPVSRGWRETLGAADAEILWPPESFEAERANSSSIVLSVRVAGKRVLLSGDIDQVATPLLIARGDDLRADVADLPHHGSFVQASPQWFGAVKPAIVLQSSGPARLRSDKWAGLLTDAKVTRLVTAQLGMVELRIEADGAIDWSAFRREPVPIEP